MLSSLPIPMEIYDAIEAGCQVQLAGGACASEAQELLTLVADCVGGFSEFAAGDACPDACTQAVAKVSNVTNGPCVAEIEGVGSPQSIIGSFSFYTSRRLQLEAVTLEEIEEILSSMCTGDCTTMLTRASSLATDCVSSFSQDFCASCPQPPKMYIILPTLLM